MTILIIQSLSSPADLVTLESYTSMVGDCL